MFSHVNYLKKTRDKLSLLAAATVLVATLIVGSSTVSAAPATQSNPANTKAAADCKSDQEAVKINSGPKRGKWYCKDKPQAGVGGGQAIGGGGGQGNGLADNAAGCGGGNCGNQCGSGNNAYTPVIDIGCKGKGNPIMDALFGIIRFLSIGVGLVVVGSIIMGGIQYTASRGDPQATAMAINRIRSSLFALVIYIFAYAILNYIIPGGVLK